jgi:hypothetical protein
MQTKTQKIVDRMIKDDVIGDEPEEKDATLVVVAAWVAGTNLASIRKETGLSAARIRPYADRLKKSGVWRRGKVVAGPWNDDEELSIEIMLQINVALGFVERAARGAGRRKELGEM